MFYPVKKKSDDLKQSLTKPTFHWSVPIHESGILRRGNASLLRLRVGPHNPGAPLHLKAFGVGAQLSPAGRPQGSPANFRQFTGGRLAKELGRLLRHLSHNSCINWLCPSLTYFGDRSDQCMWG